MEFLITDVIIHLLNLHFSISNLIQYLKFTSSDANFQDMGTILGKQNQSILDQSSHLDGNVFYGSASIQFVIVFHLTRVVE